MRPRYRCKIDQGVSQVEAEAAKLFRATQIPYCFPMDYGKALRIGRAIAGLQQKELAELAEIDPSHISLIEVGKRKPSVDMLKRLAKALQIPDHLFTLLAAEPEDLDVEDPKELERATQSLAQLLLRHATHSRFRGKLPLFPKKT
jgi:transcriptional regulator with XRE-family HTH domain